MCVLKSYIYVELKMPVCVDADTAIRVPRGFLEKLAALLSLNEGHPKVPSAPCRDVL